jgi:hypothetical protein
LFLAGPQVVADYIAAETEVGVVGDGDGVVEVLVADHRQHRAEDLLAGDHLRRSFAMASKG